MPDSKSLLPLLMAALIGGLVARWSMPAPVQAQTADSGARYVAATTEYQAGVGLLFVIDQQTQNLAVYEARGGAPNGRRVVFIGARDISLDTMLPGFNDESEFSYNDLKRQFERKKIPIDPEEED